MAAAGLCLSNDDAVAIVKALERAVEEGGSSVLLRLRAFAHSLHHEALLPPNHALLCLLPGRRCDDGRRPPAQAVIPEEPLRELIATRDPLRSQLVARRPDQQESWPPDL